MTTCARGAGTVTIFKSFRISGGAGRVPSKLLDEPAYGAF